MVRLIKSHGRVIAFTVLISPKTRRVKILSLLSFGISKQIGLVSSVHEFKLLQSRKLSQLQTCHLFSIVDRSMTRLKNIL